MNSPWVGGFLAGAVVAATTPVAMRAARRTGVVDRPGPLKPQQDAVPYLGGLAVGCGLLAEGMAAGTGRLVVAPLAAMALGLADDIGDLPVSARLVGELGVGTLAATALRGVSPLALVGAAGTNVVLVNAINLIDGLDGLAGGVATVGAVGFTVLVDGPARTLGAGLAGALVGFLIYNRAPARIYLGDAGSYLVGTALAELLVLAWARPRPVAHSLACSLLVAYPLAELGSSVVRRWRGRRPLMQGDRYHSYDRLVAAGWSPNRTSLACTAGQAALAAGALLTSRMSARGAGLTVAAIAAALAVGAAAGGLLAGSDPT